MNGAADGPICAAAMRDATEVIAKSIREAGRNLEHRLTGYSGAIRNAESALVNAAEAGSPLPQVVSGTGARGPWLIGWDGQYRHFTFESRHIRSMPLVDHEGRIIGVSFPTKAPVGSKSDREHYTAWSRMPNRASDTEFVPEVRTTRAGSREPEWQEQGPALPAPWAEDAQDGLLYVHAHAGRRGFEIEANVGTDDDPDWRTLLVPGRFFGHVLAADRNFREASLAAPHRPVLMLACGAGDPAYGHALQAAEILHRAGMHHDVYATVGLNRARMIEADGTAWVGVEVPDGTSATDAVVTIRAPDDAAPTATTEGPPITATIHPPAQLRHGTPAPPAAAI